MRYDVQLREKGGDGHQGPDWGQRGVGVHRNISHDVPAEFVLNIFSL